MYIKIDKFVKKYKATFNYPELYEKKEYYGITY